APTGERLADLVDGEHPLDWAATRGLLDQLTGELQAAVADGTLPAVLAPDQVWVQPTGRVQLLDRFPEGTAAGAPGDDAEERKLSLLRQVAILALEGRARSERDAAGPVRAVAPLHARTLLDRLT